MVLDRVFGHVHVVGELSGVGTSGEGGHEFGFSGAEAVTAAEKIYALGRGGGFDGDSDVRRRLFGSGHAGGAEAEPGAPAEVDSCPGWVRVHAGFMGNQLGADVVCARRYCLSVAVGGINALR